jgi:hypothetical protein
MRHLRVNSSVEFRQEITDCPNLITRGWPAAVCYLVRRIALHLTNGQFVRLGAVNCAWTLKRSSRDVRADLIHGRPVAVHFPHTVCHCPSATVWNQVNSMRWCTSSVVSAVGSEPNAVSGMESTS